MGGVSVTNPVVCAQLINVTGSCRRRRGIIASEAPVVMILDEGLEDVEEYFNPSAPLSVETTAKMMIPKQLDLNQQGSSSPQTEIRSSRANFISSRRFKQCN